MINFDAVRKIVADAMLGDFNEDDIDALTHRICQLFGREPDELEQSMSYQLEGMRVYKGKPTECWFAEESGLIRCGDEHCQPFCQRMSLPGLPTATE